MHKKFISAILFACVLLPIISGCLTITFEPHTGTENNIEIRFETQVNPDVTLSSSPQAITPTQTDQPTDTLFPSLTVAPSFTASLPPTPILFPRRVLIYANQDWQDTGINVSANDTVSLKYISGTWTINSRADPYVNADGYSRTASYSILPSANLGALIGRVGSGKLFVVGSQKDFVPSSTGNIYLRMNDGVCGDCSEPMADNLGQVLVEIMVKSASSTSTACDGDELAFITTRDGNEEVYVMKSDGTSLTNLTQDTASDGHPAWSPNGDKIAFHSNRTGDYEIYVMKSSGSDITRLTNSSNWDGQPSWSPDGTRIAFESKRTGISEVFVMMADGTEVRNLTQGLSGGYPSWSPDGTKIAFQSSGQHGNHEIYEMNSDGSNIIRLTYTAGYESWMTTWSPDSQKIIFSSNLRGHFELYSMNTEGKDIKRLTNNSGDNRWPVSFSPDGKKLAFTSNRFGSWDVFLMNSDGTNVIRLTDDPGEDKSPVWVHCP